MASDKPVKQKPASHAYRVSTDAVRHAYRRERAAAMGDRLARRQQLAAEIADAAAVTMARETGYAVFPPGTFDLVPEVVDAARALVSRVDLARKREEANKPFLVKLADSRELTLESPLVRFGLGRDILAGAARYLGMVPILQFANVLYSSHAAAEPAKSQLYHCDSDEVEQVKIFILCEEVTTSSGPLTFLSASDSQVVRDRVGYLYKTRLVDKQVYEALGGRVEETALTGPAGTTAFLDTSRCLHYGSRFLDPGARRLVVMLQYVTPLAFLFPDDYRAEAKLRHLAAPWHDELTTLVLGAD